MALAGNEIRVLLREVGITAASAGGRAAGRCPCWKVLAVYKLIGMELAGRAEPESRSVSFTVIRQLGAFQPKKSPSLISQLPILKVNLLAGVLWDFSVVISLLPQFWEKVFVCFYF